MITLQGALSPLELYNARNHRMGSLNYNLAEGTYELHEEDGTKIYVSIDNGGNADFITDASEMELMQEAQLASQFHEAARITEQQIAYILHS